jgi:putative ABC transport system ATP-binding protein
MNTVVRLVEAYKSYMLEKAPQPVLRGISLDIAAGEFVAIVGPSGNGKSTLINLMTGIDRPCSGQIHINGTALHGMGEERLARWRATNVGIVFQFFQLLPSLTLLQNVMLPMEFAGKVPRSHRRERALALLRCVALADQADQLPSLVSGGQQQRAAIARALANDPPLIVADEPTGNLDAQTAEDVFQLFTGLIARGKTLVMVTHNEHLARAASRRIEIRNGRIAADSGREPASPSPPEAPPPAA